MSRVKGLSHITIICRDIDKTANLFQSVFDAKIIYSSGSKTHSVSKEIFLDVAGIWLAIMEGEPVERSYNHIAFEIDVEDLKVFEEKLIEHKITILPSRKREQAEGQSLYFYDYDSHLFELHTGNLETRLRYYHDE